MLFAFALISKNILYTANVKKPKASSKPSIIIKTYKCTTSTIKTMYSLH